MFHLLLLSHFLIAPFFDSHSHLRHKIVVGLYSYGLFSILLLSFSFLFWVYFWGGGELFFSKVFLANAQVHRYIDEMATHSSILAWRILGTGESGRLPSMGSHRVGHD